MPFTLTLACWLLTVPGTMSLISPETAIVDAVVTVPSGGESMVTCGGVVSREIEIVAVPGVPPALCATTVMVLPPSFNGTGTEKVPELSGAGIPFTVTTALGSLTVPVTVTGLVLVKLRLIGEVMVMVGVAEKLTVRLEVVVFPATSVTTTLMVLGPALSGTPQVRAAPLTWAGNPLQVTPATPESASVTVPSMVTVGTITSVPFFGEVMARTGGVLSMLRLADAVAVLPARSRAVPETAWLAPSVEATTWVGQKSTPLSASEQLKLTVTLVLFQPAALGEGDTMAAIAGAVSSMFKVAFALAVFPALSLAVPVTV